jgi:hypothetical protein
MMPDSNVHDGYLKLKCYQHRVKYSENCFWNEIVFGLLKVSNLIERTLNLT